MNTVLSKQQIHQACAHLLQERISTALDALQDLDDTESNETKSSAGDKFETAREMIQQERMRHQNLLIEARKMEKSLMQLDPFIQHETGALGSLIETQTHTFYLGIGLGAVQVNEKMIMALSIQSPMGTLLVGTKVGDIVQHQQNRYTVLQIY
jgi:hypothetical protein